MQSILSFWLFAFLIHLHNAFETFCEVIFLNSFFLLLLENVKNTKVKPIVCVELFKKKKVVCDVLLCVSRSF
jgi:hypothetical protein